MRKFMGFCLIVIVAAADLHSASQEGYAYAADEYPVYTREQVPPRNTEYFTFSAPDDFNDSQDVQRLSKIVSPQQVVFIRTPEKNIFTITAEQLAKKDSLNIFLLSRQTNSAGLLSQLQELRQSVGQKPNVHFVKYRTPEDIHRAKQVIYNEFESLPGPSQYQENPNTPVFEYNHKSQNFQPNSEFAVPYNPVIFMITKHKPAISIQQFARNIETDAQQYLPPNLE